MLLKILILFSAVNYVLCKLSVLVFYKKLLQLIFFIKCVTSTSTGQTNLTAPRNFTRKFPLRFNRSTTTTSAPTTISTPMVKKALIQPNSGVGLGQTTTTTTTKKPKSETVQLYDECGTKDKDIHPWLAILEHTNPSSNKKRKTLSKGVLIHPQYVLTTVSSIHNSFPFWIV